MDENNRWLALALTGLKWIARLVVWVLLLAAIYIAHYVYFSGVPFDSAPNIYAIIGLTILFAAIVYLSVRRASYVGIVIGLGLMYVSIGTTVRWDSRWQRMKYLHENYVTDFTYDKYCNLSGEDKMLMEEISIYGITDCDDAGIKYQKSLD